MRVYAHWLDPEFVDALGRDVSMLERSLKVHALRGDTLILSDIQLIDSPIVYRLFARDDFRQFLRDFPGFMQVVAQPSQGDGRYSIVSRSLERATRKGWIPSGVRIPGLISDLSSLILETGWVDPDIWHTQNGKRLLATADEHTNDLRGIVHCLDHFANGGSNVVVRAPAASASETFYGVLVELRNRVDLRPEHRHQIEGTLDWIDKNIEEENRLFRSAVLTGMGGAALTRQQKMIWNTVSQAWNSAVETTIDPDAGSTGHLPYSPPIGVYRHTPYNGLLAIDTPADRTTLAVPFGQDRLTSVSWDPLTMSWTTLREIATATSSERLAFQDASVTARDNDMLEQLISAISAQIRDTADSAPRSVATVFIETVMAGGGAAFGVVFGGTGSVAVSAAAGAVGAAASAVGAHGAITALRSSFKRSTRFRIVNTLRHEFRAVLDKSE